MLTHALQTWPLQIWWLQPCTMASALSPVGRSMQLLRASQIWVFYISGCGCCTTQKDSVWWSLLLYITSYWYKGQRLRHLYLTSDRVLTCFWRSLTYQSTAVSILSALSQCARTHTIQIHARPIIGGLNPCISSCHTYRTLRQKSLIVGAYVE